MYELMILRALFIHLMVFVASVNATELKKVDVSPASGIFYHLHDVTLATHLLSDSSDEFGDLNSDKIQRLKQVPVSFLETLGLKENDKIQFVRFSDGKAREYVLGKKVFIFLFKTYSAVAMYKWGTFNLVLTDDIKEHQKLNSLPEFLPPRGDGLAFNGSQFSFVNGIYQTLHFDKLSPKDPSRKLFGLPNNDIRSSKIDGTTLLVEFDKNGPWNTSILATKDGNYFLNPVELSPQNNSFVAHYCTFIKDTKCLISYITPELECSRLYLINGTKVSYKDIHCLPKNMWAEP